MQFEVFLVGLVSYLMVFEVFNDYTMAGETSCIILWYSQSYVSHDALEWNQFVERLFP